MLHVLYGADQFRVREQMQAIRRGLERDGNLAYNTQRLEARGLTPGDLRSACQTASFFAENRLVIVDGLQARFSGARRRTRSGARTTAAAPSDLEQFIDVLSDLPPTTTVILMDEQGSTAFLDSLPAGTEVHQFAILRPVEVRQWATERLRSIGARATPQALERLLGLVDGAHLGDLAQELDKLATYAGDRAIEADDIDALVSAALQYQFWDLTDAVIAGRGERALGLLRAMDAREHPRGLLIFMLVRQYRQLLLAKSLLDQRKSQQDIGQMLGLRDFPLRKAIEQAGRYDAPRLEAAYRRLLQTDVSVKTGVLEVDTALDLLIADLAELARPPRRPRTAVR